MKRAAPAVLAVALVAAGCASGPPVTLTSRTVVGSGLLTGSGASTAPDDRPGPAVTAPAPTTGQADDRVPGAVVYDGSDPAVVASHNETRIVYPVLPPVGGVHYPQWLTCGVYDVPVPTGYAVHDMEHGAVWISYRPDLDADQVRAIRSYVAGLGDARLNGQDTGQKYVTVSPLEGQQQPVVVTAWAHQLQLTSVDTARIDRFVDLYRVREGVTPEYGAPCSGGVGTPLA